MLGDLDELEITQNSISWNTAETPGCNQRKRRKKERKKKKKKKISSPPLPVYQAGRKDKTNYLPTISYLARES
jgi:hypothetical protein